MNPRFIDWIWKVRGSVPLAPDQSRDDAFGRLDPLFRQYGTTHERTSDTLIFRKKDQAAQDKMSVFDSGVLHIENGVAGSVLRYDLTSRTLLFCFLLPLLFLGIAQLTVVIGKLEKPSAEAAAKIAKAEEKAKKEKAKKPEMPMNALDKALGAPAPEKPDAKDKKKPGGRDKKPTPTAAYVFAAIFATLYVIGRVLEDRLIRSLLRKSLQSPALPAPA